MHEGAGRVGARLRADKQAEERRGRARTVAVQTRARLSVGDFIRSALLYARRATTSARGSERRTETFSSVQPRYSHDAKSILPPAAPRLTRRAAAALALTYRAHRVTG